MSLGTTRWHVIAESEFPWEREALEWLRQHLPDRNPWQVWTNFEFIDDAGKVNEVDALVLSPAGLFLIEIKSRPGELDGDTHTWTWYTDGRRYTADNPLLLADRKAKRLAGILRRQTAIAKAKVAVPYLEPLIFLSATQLQCKLQARARSGVFLRGRPGHVDDDGLVGALLQGLRNHGQPPTDPQQAKALSKALAEAGIRPSNKHRRVGEYKLGKLIADGDDYQDWLGQHVSIDSVQRRIRIHTLASAASPEARAALVRNARREFEILEGIEHTGILRCREYKDTDLGPALVFDHDADALRLDHLMREHGARLDITRRLQLVRDIAEVLKFAHGKRLYHRGLGPQSILVRGWGSAQIAVQVMNWQTASRNADASATAHRTTGTRHVEDYVEDPGRVYLAPETAYAEAGQGAALDVYSLGSLTYLIFGGQPPADSSLALQAKLRQGQGLRLADIVDGCPPKLAELVQFSTNPDLGARYDSVGDFLKELDAVEDELTAPDPEATADPSRASVGERLEGGFTVVNRLGRGSSSDVLLVRKDGKDDQWVLKVATDPGHNESLLAEADALRKLRHPNIVDWQETLTIAGRTALLLRSAGDETLARTLKTGGRLSLDLLQRFGEELLDAVRELENQAVIHRDIKPDNIGIGQSRNGRLKLVLFDFSLSRTPVENITAGTPPYLDPFLSLRSHRRWDLSAERFAAAVTLYEMAVGKPPRWGDGQSAPALLDVEADLEADAFDPNLRQPLHDFFAKALRRDFRERFDNADDMLRGWRAVFQTATTAAPVPPDDFAALARGFDAKTSIAELGYGIEAQDQLERMGIHSLRDLLGVDRIKFRYLSGVGDRIRREIRLKAKELARLRPDLIPGDSSLYSDHGEPAIGAKAVVTVDELADILMPRRAAGDERADDDALEHYLGLDDAVPPGRWPTPGDAAGAAQIDREAFSAALLKARERWLKQPPLTELRTQMAALLESQGRVMTPRELADAILALRGCALQRDEDRLRLAHALVRAAVEAEANLESPRFQSFDHQPCHLVACDPAFAQYARALGAAADACALAEPLLPPARALEALENVARPRGAEAAGDDGPAPARLLRLATSASQRAALSSRQEIYPRGMPALLALKQSLNSLIGIREIKIGELRSRVSGRYPEAEELPRQRVLLDRLLEEAGAPLAWDGTRDRDGAYVTRALESGLTVSTATRIERRPTVSDSDAAAGVDAAAARQAEQRLTNNLRHGGLLVLGVDTACAVSAEGELMHRFGAQSGNGAGLTRLSLDALLIGALKQQAHALGARWDIVLKADAMPAGSRDAANLQQLVQRCLPALRSTLLESPAPLLLVHPGLLARFDLLPLVSELEAETGRPGRTPSLWLLLPSPQPERAAIDGRVVPLIHASSFATLPQAWVENRHRAAALA